MSKPDIERDLGVLRQAFAGRELGPAAGWGGVSAFEETHGVVLPDPYRSFIALIGDGCRAGPPACGLARLGENADVLWDPADRSRLARPFPLTRAWIWESGDPPPAPGATRDGVTNGLLLLGDDGCAAYWTLVVTGAHRGQVWQIADVGAQPFGRSFGFTTAADGFAGWADHWSGGHDWFDVTD